MAELFKHGWSIWPAMVAALLLGAVCGAFNGFLVTRLGLPSLAVTIGTLTLYRGIAQVHPADRHDQRLPGRALEHRRRPDPGTHIPYSVLFFAIVAVVFAVVLHASPPGRVDLRSRLRSGGRFFAGIRVKRIKFWLFVARRDV